MTEQEWLAGTDPSRLLNGLRGRVSDRKLRLFACACAEHVRELFTNEACLQAVATARRFADGEATREELTAAGRRVWGYIRSAVGRTQSSINADGAASRTANDSAWEAAQGAAWETTKALARAGGQPIWEEALTAGRERVMPLLREVFGDRPLAPRGDPVRHPWVGPTAVRLAEAAYQEGVFDRLAVLADVLEEGGCTDAQLLGHLRGPGPHARGCWPLDLILGRC
jgi:hypothetical protein